MWIVVRSRSNLRLEEDEDEDKQCWYATGTHHPAREGLLLSHGVDDPASGFGVGHLNTFWYNKFLQKDMMIFINTKNRGRTLTLDT